MNEIAQLLADPGVRGVYLGFCLFLMLVPMAGLWLWYRKRLKADAVDRDMLLRVALITLAWMAANAVALGILLWADTVNRAAG
jgi:tellurite resistance protein TehA-like permease